MIPSRWLISAASNGRGWCITERSGNADLSVSVGPSLTFPLELFSFVSTVLLAHLLHVLASAVALTSIQGIHVCLHVTETVRLSSRSYLKGFNENIS